MAPHCHLVPWIMLHNCLLISPCILTQLAQEAVSAVPGYVEIGSQLVSSWLVGVLTLQLRVFGL